MIRMLSLLLVVACSKPVPAECEQALDLLEKCHGGLPLPKQEMLDNCAALWRDASDDQSKSDYRLVWPEQKKVRCVAAATTCDQAAACQ